MKKAYIVKMFAGDYSVWEDEYWMRPHESFVGVYSSEENAKNAILAVSKGNVEVNEGEYVCVIDDPDGYFEEYKYESICMDIPIKMD